MDGRVGRVSWTIIEGFIVARFWQMSQPKKSLEIGTIAEERPFTSAGTRRRLTYLDAGFAAREAECGMIEGMVKGR